MLNYLCAAAAAAAFLIGGAKAATFDSIFVEGDNRPGAVGDIPDGEAFDIGAIGPGQTIGIGGRIVNGVDVWSFAVSTPFSISFTDLMLGDGNSGFDSTTTAFAPSAANDSLDAEFALLDADDGDRAFFSLILTSSTVPFEFFSGPAGNYKLLIDASINVDVQDFGSTYDIAITAAPAPVPVPAALPLLATGLGVLVALRRRSRA